jgi:hypothetical protein
MPQALHQSRKMNWVKCFFPFFDAGLSDAEVSEVYACGRLFSELFMCLHLGLFQSRYSIPYKQISVQRRGNAILKSSFFW